MKLRDEVDRSEGFAGLIPHGDVVEGGRLPVGGPGEGRVVHFDEWGGGRVGVVDVLHLSIGGEEILLDAAD